MLGRTGGDGEGILSLGPLIIELSNVLAVLFCCFYVIL